MAEPARSNLPGPVVYWLAVVLVVLLAVALAAVLMQRLGSHRHEPPDKRRRLGVDTQARLATTRDLAPLLDAPAGARPLRARRGGADAPLLTEGRRARPARGVRGAVAVFGPIQSGKTTGLIDGVGAWAGPAIVSSVKTDLLRATIEDRRAARRGQGVRPARRERHAVGELEPAPRRVRPGGRARRRAGACPRRAARRHRTIASGAARPSSSSPPCSGPRPTPRATRCATSSAGSSSWTDRTATTAAPSPRSFGCSPTTPTRRPPLAARQVQGWLHGQWSTDPRTTSSVYATARNAVWPWADPAIAATADGCDITLDWLLADDNTLYLSAPLGDETRIGVVFAVLLHDLIAQAFDRYNRTGEALDPRLLVLLDEAANTPLPKLPQWASTVTGAGIQLVTVWQSKAQLDKTYGKDAETVLTNHRSKLIYPSGISDLATVQYIERARRRRARPQRPRRTERHRREDRRTGRSPATAVRLLTPNVLGQMQVGDAVLLHGQLPPAWLRAKWS